MYVPEWSRKLPATEPPTSQLTAWPSVIVRNKKTFKTSLHNHIYNYCSLNCSLKRSFTAEYYIKREKKTIKHQHIYLNDPIQEILIATINILLCFNKTNMIYLNIVKYNLKSSKFPT